MTRSKQTTWIGLTILALAAVPVASAQCEHSAKAIAHGGEKPDIVQTAVSAGQFNTLVAAVKAAGLVEALQGDGPFTVFAPTDDAFAKLPKGTLESLLKPENKAKLQAILKYHVVAGKLPASKVTGQSGATTLNGQRLDFVAKDGSVHIDRAKVVKADIHCANGVIHVIDTVMLPSDDNIVETAGSTGKFNTLLKAATAAGLADTLANGGPFTVFAPTDEAFAKLPDGAIADLLKPANRDKLVQILKYHVISGRVYSDAVSQQRSGMTLAERSVRFRTDDGKVRVDDATVVMADVDASNGVVHVIDSVLIPG